MTGVQTCALPICRRNALKMWCGWPTFPMVFVKGTLVGGADELQKLLESGELGGKRPG